ncbi:hypothetical protein [Desulfolutivibrio sulfoxidireducens]|uniref:hypothetical protein n=1 Tax=Desulfolutivibrio sulfoxidireducens TaxID=2773299 RepID=UPI00159DBAEE|nr:hypothetical protein [Desulfolutivibrio sulfoxidireducens]QLA18464.1 hypothetical protein GD604_01350 [Desulfolutivibrio sulfoxidireducens]
MDPPLSSGGRLVHIISCASQTWESLFCSEKDVPERTVGTRSGGRILRPLLRRDVFSREGYTFLNLLRQNPVLACREISASLSAMRKSDALSPAEKTAKARRRCRRALWWIIALYLVTTPLLCYKYIIYSYLPQMFYDWGPFFTFILIISTEGYSVYLAIRYFRLPWLQSFYPFFIFVIAHNIIGAINPYETNIKSYSSVFRDEREQFVKYYCSNELQKQNLYSKHRIVLPQELRHIAVEEGLVDITCDTNRQTGLFFTMLGMFDSWHGLMYQSDDSFPDDPHITDAYEITKIEKNWYYISH